MNVLIGYDGSPGSDLALEDLLLAGLPWNVDFTVISVADVWSELISAHSRYDEMYPHSMATARAMASEAMAEAHGHAERGANWLGTHFPRATVRAVAIADSPSRGLVREAEERWADLLVVGSHGRSMFGRLFLGSVSHHAMTFAQCSVRVAHHSDSVVGAPLRLVVGTDGSPGAGAALRAVTQRNWPQGTAVRVVVAVERPLSLLMPGPHGLGGTRLPENGDDLKAWGFHAAKAAADGLHRAGLSAVPVVREGSPKRVLTEEADEWNADCIFVGAHGLRGSERSAPGSVAIAVGVRSRCTVEVVRAPANVATT